MIFAIVAIIFSIISFFQPWFFIAAAISLVLSAGEYIFELAHGEAFDSAATIISVVVVGILALTLTVISIIVSLKAINNPDHGQLLIDVLNLIRITHL